MHKYFTISVAEYQEKSHKVGKFTFFTLTNRKSIEISKANVLIYRIV